MSYCSKCIDKPLWLNTLSFAVLMALSAAASSQTAVIPSKSEQSGAGAGTVSGAGAGAGAVAGAGSSSGTGLSSGIQSDASIGLKPTPTAWRATYETWKLPENEKMGMLGINLLFDVHENVKLGLGSYGALSGERGGFITLGLAGELQHRLSPSWRVHGGLFVGGGGGRDGLALAGGGLMFRADAGITYETHGYGNIGLGVSYVSFPSGSIRSTQPYVMYEYPFFSAIHNGWDRPRTSGSNRDGLISSNRQEFAVTYQYYKIPSSVVRDDGTPQYGNIQLIGAEWLSYLDDRWFIKVESAGAAGGQSNGYMQIMGGGGYRLPLSSSTALKIFATAGPAGGGGVDTGGGFLFGGGLALQQNITKRTAIEFSVGGVRAPSASFKALNLGVNLNYQFGLPKAGSDMIEWSSLSNFDSAPIRVRAVNQTYLKGSDNWRSRDENMSVNTIGIQLDCFLSPNWFMTGQGLAAYSGKAGAYMAGLVGGGAHVALSDKWFLEAEALIGAAGGGSINVGSGLIGQYNIGIGYQASKSLSFMLTGGQIAAANGDFRATVIGASVGYRFLGFTAN